MMLARDWTITMDDHARVYFEPGDAVAIVASRGLVVFGLGAPPMIVDAVERALHNAERSIALLEAFGAFRLAELPSFGLAFADDDAVRVVARGDVAVRVHAGGSETCVDAGSVASWREEIYRVTDSVEFLAPATSPYVNWSASGRFGVSSVRWRSSRVAGDVISRPFHLGMGAEQAAADDRPDPAILSMTAPSRNPEGSDVDSAEVDSAEVEATDVESPEAESVPLSVVPPPIGRPISIEPDEDGSEIATGGTEVRPRRRPSPNTSDRDEILPTGGAFDVSATPTISYVPPHETLIRERPSSPAPDSAIGTSDPDHDGHTIVRRRRTQLAPSTPAQSQGLGPLVQAVRCPAGHPNPPAAMSCRLCSLAIGDRTVATVERPRMGVLRFSNGIEVPLDGPLVIGRMPSYGAIVDGEAATPVTIDNSELSRSHATVHLSDWSIHIVDPGSTNGTSVVLPGQAPTLCDTGMRMMITPGTVVDLGNVVTFRYDVE
jgi:hypothetical protein